MSEMHSGGRTAIVLGGGVGGVVAANRLRKLLPRSDRVVLIERERDHLFQASLLWLAVGWRRADAIARPLARLSRKGIDVVQAHVTRIDPVARTVTAGDTTYTGDAIVIALGAELAPEAIPELEPAGHNLYSLSGAGAIQSAVSSIETGRIVILTAAPAYKCPAAPYEAALLIDGALRKRGVRSRVTVDLYAAEPGPMGVAGPDVSAAVRGMVESHGIGYHPAHQVTSVDRAARRVQFSNGQAAEYDLLVYVPPHRAPAVVKESGLTNETGWIPVDRHTMATAAPAVFAVGDVTTIPLTIGKPLPKAGVFAHAQAEVVAFNIAREWAGRPERRRFDGHGLCFVETGDGRAGVGAGNFYGEPSPRVKLRAPSRMWHWAKVAFEKWWFARWL